jgi:hypothetical protein
VSEIQALKNNQLYSSLFGWYGSSEGVNPIVSKLPHNIQEKWITKVSSLYEDMELFIQRSPYSLTRKNTQWPQFCQEGRGEVQQRRAGAVVQQRCQNQAVFWFNKDRTARYLKVLLFILAILEETLQMDHMKKAISDGLPPSCITLSFDRFGSISWHNICFFRLLYSFHNLFFRFPTFSTWTLLKRLD